MFFTSSGEGSGVTVKGPLTGKHTRSSSVSSLEGAFLSPLTSPESTPKETVKKKKGFFERLSKSVGRQSKSGQVTTRKISHSPRVVSGSPLRAPTVTPPVIPEKLPAFATMAAGEDITVADLTRQLKQAFEEISLGANYPMPTFNGKKGENPEDHCMKAEDYFKVYKIVRDEDKRRRFTDTLFLTGEEVVTSVGEGHLGIGVNRHRIQETTDETKLMGHSGLGVRIFPIEVIRDMA